MRKLSKTSMLCAFIIATLVAFANARKVTKLHFYVQDLLGGPNQSVWEVARANITSTSPTSFGLVRVADDLITAKPEANSTKLGRLQGLVTFANFKELAPIMNLIVVFTSGTYSGSTLCLVGRNSISDQ
ncbi:dirigent protein 21-like [Olea europaea var. sylvestris]|uniref:dirigent protein 21-like n=1 Tax=Olea europaea var. sylvestris TaxID=158386 RepID=UPI000C1D0EC3|nr:dirigent protein 21-like [Olea europaea var. sylvestris]